MISARYHKRRQGTEASITLPNSLSGTLVWKGKSYQLHAGEQMIHLP
jgi:hypothetical protein